MRRVLDYLLLLLSAAALSACEIPFELDNISEPKFYVEFMPSSSGRTILAVAKADPAFERPSALHELQEDDLEVKCNGRRVKVVKTGSDGNLHYFELPVASFSAGDEVELSMSGSQVQEASGRTVIPPAPELASVDIKAVEGDSTGVSRVSFKLQGAVPDGDYYGLQIIEREVLAVATLSDNPLMPIEKVDTMTYFHYLRPGQIATVSDINSLDLDAFASINYWGSGLSDIEGEAPMTLLGSRQFSPDGEYSFYLNFSFFGEWEYSFPDAEAEEEGPKTILLGSESWYMVLVYRLSDELYNWAKAQYLMEFNMLSNFGVTPPNFTYSNVKGGLGIVGGISLTASPWLADPGNPGRFPEAGADR